MSTLMERSYRIRKGVLSDAAQIKDMYCHVASVPDGLARSVEEVTDAFIQQLVDNAVSHGFLFVAEYDRKLIGMVCTFQAELKVFAHVWLNTVALVNPDYQGQGVGTALMTTLLDDITSHHSDIMRVELFTRESNPAQRLYKRLGFVQEGRFERRAKNHDGTFTADIAMAWTNPNFKG